MSKAKKKTLEDVYFPVPQTVNLSSAIRPPVNQAVIKKIVQGAVKGAYGLSIPSYMDSNPKALADAEQIEMIVHLIEALQPTDAIEAALASQFAITYIRGLETSSEHYLNLKNLRGWFEFGHQVLDTLQKYRSKGAQKISVQYNVNHGQVLNQKVYPQPIMEEVII